MSDSLEYASKFGRITIVSSTAGDNLCCPDDIEQALASYANSGMELHGKLLVQPGSFVLLKSCFESVEKFGRQPHHFTPNGSLVQLLDATDDQLRAECERRGIIGDDSKAALVDDRDSLWVQVNDLRQQLQAEKDDHDAHEAKLARDRDEWKRRAEAAEAKASDKDTAEALYAMWSGEPQSRYVDRREFARMVERAESGPGIAKRDMRPDNSIAHLPEDLLCEDA